MKNKISLDTYMLMQAVIEKNSGMYRLQDAKSDVDYLLELNNVEVDRGESLGARSCKTCEYELIPRNAFCSDCNEQLSNWERAK